MSGVKGRQSGHNKATGKYAKQRIRTTANKARRIAKHNTPKSG